MRSICKNQDEPFVSDHIVFLHENKKKVDIIILKNILISS